MVTGGTIRGNSFIWDVTTGRGSEVDNGVYIATIRDRDNSFGIHFTLQQ